MTRLQVMQLPLVSGLGFRVRSRQMSATVIPGGRRLGGNKCPTPARSSERSTDGLCVCGTDSCWRAQSSVSMCGEFTPSRGVSLWVVAKRRVGGDVSVKKLR